MENRANNSQAKKMTKQQEWGNYCDQAIRAIDELIMMQGDFQGWLDTVPDNLQAGATFDRLEQVCEFDLSGAVDMLMEAIDVELPRGYRLAFGRD
tara:strand:+ start:195 stop:479 length:285 start_codon:yes stop_codon:yes gene_type:complete